MNLGQPYFPSPGNLLIDFNLGAPSLKLNMSGGNVGLGIDGHFDSGQLSGLSDINIQFIGGRPSSNFSLEDLPDNVDIADLAAAVESLLTDWRPATGPATDWINSYAFDLNNLHLGLDFVPNQTTVDISGAFDTGNLRGRAEFGYLKEDREASVSGYLNIDLNNIDLQDALSMADSLFPKPGLPPPARRWTG
jgi:hypothetical protein